MNLPFVVMGAMLQSRLKGEKNDLLTPEKLLEVAGRRGTVPTRIRYCREEDPETGRLKAAGYHTGPESGRDQVKVRLLEKNFSGSYEFWQDGELNKPLMTWTPADAPGSSDPKGWHTDNDAAVAGTVEIPGLDRHRDKSDEVKSLETSLEKQKHHRTFTQKINVILLRTVGHR